MKNWNIPKWLANEVIERDKHCVYCGVKMLDMIPKYGSKNSAASWEYIINDETMITRKNIARCCVACNANKGTKKLSEWINSKYCEEKGITKDSVADIIKAALKPEI